MECRIQVDARPDTCTVSLAGHLRAEQVPELCRLCGTVGSRVRIDLTDLLSADPIGIDALRRLGRGGAEFVGVAQYLRRLIV
jgi:hypothetical protein